MKAIFFGTPQFAAKILEDLLPHITIAAVVTKPDRAQGRSKQLLPTPVKQIALAQSPPIPLFQPELVSAEHIADTLAAFQADLFIVVAYGEIIKQHLLDMPKIACINLHASLLPKYRGAAPIQRAIMNGEKVTGVTVMHMVKKMDAGDIIKAESVEIGNDETFSEIEQKLCEVGSNLLLDVIEDFKKGEIIRIPQDHSEATYAPKIELEDCQINWNLPAQDLHNLVRAVSPEPGAWCYVSIKDQKKRLKVLKSKVHSAAQATPGELIAYGKEGLVVGCGHAALQILILQLEGKSVMNAEELMRGIPRHLFSFTFEDNHDTSI